MLWFGRKNKTNIEDDSACIDTEEPVYEEEIDEDESVIGLESEDEDEDEDEAPEADVQVVQLISSFDELCEYINKKPIGHIQYMRKDSGEVFSLREGHLHMARVWGSISMSREYSEREYARIMLALELLEAPEDFYILPMFTNDEMRDAIMSFCSESFGENGKKYAKNTQKFAAFLKSNDCVNDWYEYTESLMKIKLEEFCSKNGISFKKEAADE